jgi:hypothetical protein
MKEQMREAFESRMKYAIECLNILWVSHYANRSDAAIEGLEKCLTDLAALSAVPAQVPESIEAHLMSKAHEYWKIANRRHTGAVQWIRNDETGALLVFTRGEYSDSILSSVIEIIKPLQSQPQQPAQEPAPTMSQFASKADYDAFRPSFVLPKEQLTVKPVSIKTWQEHLTNVFYSDSDETQCRDKEVAELRAALEALQADHKENYLLLQETLQENAAQAKRIEELYDVANDHRDSYIAASKALDLQKAEIEALRKQVEELTKGIIDCTNGGILYAAQKGTEP